MKKIVKGLAGLLSAGVISLLTLTLMIQASLPDDFSISEGEEFYINSNMSVKATKNPMPPEAAVYKNGEVYSLSLNLFEGVPIKQVSVQVVPGKMVIPGGSPFGIKMFTKGVMIVGMSDLQIGIENINPAKNAGLKMGDILLSIDGNTLVRNEDVAKYMAESNGNTVEIAFRRGDSDMSVYLQPVKTEYDNKYRAGIWVRDSSAGIGTLTYYDPETMGFAGLGHAICDVDTGKLMPLSSGEIVNVNISGFTAGLSGKPGELRGSFTGNNVMGRLDINCEYGIFGKLNHPCLDADPVPMAYKQEIQCGPAIILSTISGSKPQSFEINIEKINYMDSSSTKNMVIRVVDPGLLSATGGIVQGMSGSPILQNGKLIGAVTHVFVNDPTRGYAIFAEYMDSQLKFVEKQGIAS